MRESPGREAAGRLLWITGSVKAGSSQRSHGRWNAAAVEKSTVKALWGETTAKAKART